MMRSRNSACSSNNFLRIRGCLTTKQTTARRRGVLYTISKGKKVMSHLNHNIEITNKQFRNSEDRNHQAQ
jgi:hypothetical protein